MIAKKYRLSRKDFINCLKSAKALSSPLFTLRYLENSLEHSRWSVVIPKKISKKAVDRNGLKRRIYESLRKHISNLKIDGIIYPRPLAINLDYEKLSLEIDSLVSKISGIS